MASSSESVRGEVGPSLPAAAARGASVSRPESEEPDRRFPRTFRLTARRQFRQVYQKGQRVGTASLTFFGTRNDLGYSRLGLTVTRKVGGAVRRNRAKRVLRDIFRRHRQELPVSLDLVINVRPSMVDRSTARIEHEFLEGIRALGRRLAR